MLRKSMIVGGLLLAVLLVMLGSGVLLAQDATPTPRPLADPDAPDGERDPHAVQAPEACSVPTTATVRGKLVEFDQCFEKTFSHGGTSYRVHVFYTEVDDPDNLAQCSASENAAGRCEHALSNADDVNGNNINAVEMADEAEKALRFYLDRNLSMISGTTLTVLLAEDPRGGGINTPSTLYADDELVDNTDDLWKRLLAFHEGMHLVQDKYDSLVGWRTFYGEGIARAIEDRVDTALDADTGHLFIPEVNGLLSNSSGVRDADVSTISYSSVLWWTWLFDQYRNMADAEPTLGWQAVRDFYLELNTEANELDAVDDFIASRGGSFRDDFIDYTLSLYAYNRSPANARLTYADSQIRSSASGLSGHTVITGGPAFGTVSLALQPRSSRYIEFAPASQCNFISFTFDGNGSDYGFSVMTADGGVLQKRWTSYSDTWQRTVRSSDLDSVVGVVTAFDNSGTVDIGRGCVAPKLNIKNPTTAAFEMIGTADNPRNFIVRLDVDGEDGSGVAGLVASDFTVELQKAGGGPVLAATILNAVYVQDDYWLLVEPPTDADGAQTGQFYNLTARLGSQSDTENSAVLYVKRTQDVVVVLDRSGSMSVASGKIAAARNAAALLVNELADDDQGGYVAFDTTASLREALQPVGSGPGSHREALELAIAGEVPLSATSVGDGMITAAVEHDAHRNPANMCSFVLLSDGYENSAPMWADVRPDVVDNGCAIHSIALGPEANELLMQQIAAAVPGGSYDYADNNGSVPILAVPDNQSLNAAAAPAVGVLSWENNLSRIYDAKAVQIAGRQRFQTAQSLGSDNEPFQEYRFYVDETVDELVISVAWQNPTKGEQTFKLVDPGGNSVTPDWQRASENGTNEVLRVNKPAEGMWLLVVDNLYQEYFVSVTGASDYELYLFIGTPLEQLSQGAIVPLLATFVGPGKPVVGATVIATVRAPDGTLTDVMLHDDGSHGDAEPEDGVYGGYYTATAAADAEVPEKVIENEEPKQVGSYLVTAVGTFGELRREAQGSFAIETGRDDNQNRLPDIWEERYGVKDPEADDDNDRLTNYCEFQLGTVPTNPDTDGGGESDGSEAPNCQPTGQNPLDPSDDRVGPILGGNALPILKDKLPLILVTWSSPTHGRLDFINLYRRVTGGNGRALAQDWQLLAHGVSGNAYEDAQVTSGLVYEYLIEPFGTGEGGQPATGGALVTNAALASDDPYAPAGSILINDGAPATDSLRVTLTIAADDFFGGEDGGEAEPGPGTPTEELEMRISNSSDYSGAAWQPFAATVADWDLGSVAPGATAVVYIQFRDAAGNVSTSGFAHMDSIRYLPAGVGTLYLPVILRP